MLDNGSKNGVCRNAVGAPRREESEDIGSDPRWTISEYCQESGGMTNVGRFSALAVDSNNLVMNDRNGFWRDAA